jgi:hypothetical protein
VYRHMEMVWCNRHKELVWCNRHMELEHLRTDDVLPSWRPTQTGGGGEGRTHANNRRRTASPAPPRCVFVVKEAKPNSIQHFIVNSRRMKVRDLLTASAPVARQL